MKEQWLSLVFKYLASLKQLTSAYFIQFPKLEKTLKNTFNKSFRNSIKRLTYHIWLALPQLFQLLLVPALPLELSSWKKRSIVIKEQIFTTEIKDCSIDLMFKIIHTFTKEH